MPLDYAVYSSISIEGKLSQKILYKPLPSHLIEDYTTAIQHYNIAINMTPNYPSKQQFVLRNQA